MSPITLAQSLFLLLGVAGLSAAHPGHHEDLSARQLDQKMNFFAKSKRSLDACSDSLARREVLEKSQARRKAKIAELSKNDLGSVSSLKGRDLTTVLNTDHESDLTGVTSSTSEDVFFSDNTTCLLNPEGEVGPFWVKGEYIRSDLSEDQEGVSIYIDAQFVDVSTCEPISGLYWDIWNANATGVYSGVVGSGNGNSADASNINNTFLRGLQPTDDDGVAQFQTIFPGHYSGRTNHIHVIAHIDATVLANGTLTGGNIPHIGQFFFDQSLIDEVEATSPYSTNTNSITTNAEDRVIADETSNSTSDPVFEYVLLGDTVADGLFLWIDVGVDVSASYTASYAAFYGSGGGIAESGGPGPA